MALLRSVFGPSKDEIWNQIASDIGGHYHDGGFFGRDVLRYQSGEWEITLDTFSQSNGDHGSTTYTRMRAPFVNRDGLRFKIYREGVFSSMGKFFGMQDIQINDPFFDDKFIIKGNSEAKIRRLLDDTQLKELIHTQPKISFQVRDDRGWFGTRFPEGVDELHFQCVGVIKNEMRLKELFALLPNPN